MEKVCKNCGAAFTTNRSAREYCGYACSNAVTATERERRKVDRPALSVWSCGGGVQSTAIAVLIEQGKLPKPDFAFMTDCGYEQRTTLEYVNSITIPRMKAIGVTLNIVKTTDYTNNDLIDVGGHIVIPAYQRMPDGRIIKFNTHCNETWKVRTAKRWMREQGMERCVNWIGISTDEKKRARPSVNKWVTLRYPLLELGLNREDCLWLICGAGWPKPPRSSCFFCPQRNDRQWQEMRENNPDDYERALEVEEIVQAHDPTVFLHRTCRRLKDVFGDIPIGVS